MGEEVTRQGYDPRSKPQRQQRFNPVSYTHLDVYKRQVRQQVEGETLYEIGYHLRRDLWGQGLATEAAIACRDWAFAHLQSGRLISLIRPENLPSRRVAERVGMSIWKEVNWRGFQHYVYSITA